MVDMSIATCGHWCAVYIKRKMLIEDFYNYIESFNKADLDKLVVELFYNEP